MNNRRIRKKLFGVFFQFPSVLLYTVFLIFPAVSSLYYALLKWDGITEKHFIGLGNFADLLFQDRYFSTILGNTAISMLAGLLIQIPLALILAYMVFRTERGFRFFQSAYFVPVVISATIIGLMFSLFFNPVFGPVNTLLNDMGLEELTQNWLSDPGVVLFSVILPGVWQYLGYYFIILLAAMQSIPKEMLESAVIDGANTVQIFRRIMIPNIKGMIQVCIVINLTGSIKTFDIPYMMTQGGPGASSTFLSIYMYKEAFIDSSIGKGTAVAVCMLLMAIGVTVAVNLLFAWINRKD